MAKYEGWTLGETEALLNVVGGVDMARAVLRGERKLTVEEIVQQSPPPKPPLVGTVVKTLRLNPYKAKSLAEAIMAGKYDNDTAEILRQFAEDDMGLADAVEVNLVQFDRDPWYDEMLMWGKENHKRPILPKHLLGIGSQHPDEQRKAPIVALGSARVGYVLCLSGHSGWRGLYRDTVQSDWRRSDLFGFVSE